MCNYCHSTSAICERRGIVQRAGNSTASTYVTIGPVPALTDTDQQQEVTVPDYTMPIVHAAIAIIIAVAAATRTV